MVPRPVGGGNAMRKCKGELGFRTTAKFVNRGTKWYSVVLNSKNLVFPPFAFSGSVTPALHADWKAEKRALRTTMPARPVGAPPSSLIESPLRREVTAFCPLRKNDRTLPDAPAPRTVLTRAQRTRSFRHHCKTWRTLPVNARKNPTFRNVRSAISAGSLRPRESSNSTRRVGNTGAGRKRRRALAVREAPQGPSAGPLRRGESRSHQVSFPANDSKEQGVGCRESGRRVTSDHGDLNSGRPFDRRSKPSRLAQIS
jgi:hypothetical protein